MKTIISTIFFLIFSFSVVLCQESREKEFLKLIAHIDSFCECDYRDLIPLKKDSVIIVSDFKDNPILKRRIEANSFSVLSNLDISRYKVQTYIYPTKLIISKDSSYIEFQVINKMKKSISGKLSLIRNSKSGKEKLSKYSYIEELITETKIEIIDVK